MLDPQQPVSQSAAPASQGSDWKQRLRQPGMLFENLYVWLIFLSAMDVMLTWVILFMGGSEVNAIARAVIARFDLGGAVLFKFALVTLAIVSCEWVGRERPQSGRRLAWCAVLLSGVPVVWAFILLTAHRFAGQ